MKKEIVIKPVSRIEGHAKVVIKLGINDSVKEARFQVTDFRGFEKFTEGRPFYEMPRITSRVCGICPVSHLLSSSKACDQIIGVEPPTTAIKLRRLIHMGQLIQSHALNLFYLSFPDMLFGMDSNPTERNFFGLIKRNIDIANQGIKLRKFGQEIIQTLAGKRVHPSHWVVPGGVQVPLQKEKTKYLLSEVPKALNIALKTLATFKKWVPALEEEIQYFGNFPSYYMGLVTPKGGLEHYDGKIRIVDPKGKAVADQIDPNNCQEVVGEATETWTYMKFPYYKRAGYPEGAYRVGPLARLNVASQCDTPLANQELTEFKSLSKDSVVESSFLYHQARLVELIYCIETAEKLLKDPEIHSENIRAKAEVNNKEGIGVIEAPRGTLIHHYKVNRDGIIQWVNMIIATEHNNIAYNKAIKQVSEKYLCGNNLTEGLLNRVEAVIRAFDPCLSCATHAIGKMALDVQLHNSEGKLLDRVIQGETEIC